MKKTMSRILTLVLVLAMLVSVVPMALAAENDAGSITIADPGTVKAGESVKLTANVYGWQCHLVWQRRQR